MEEGQISTSTTVTTSEVDDPLDGLRERGDGKERRERRTIQRRMTPRPRSALGPGRIRFTALHTQRSAFSCLFVFFNKTFNESSEGELPARTAPESASADCDWTCGASYRLGTAPRTLWPTLD